MTELWEGVVLAVAFFGLLLYFPTNWIHAPGRWFFHDTWLDDNIPLVPYFIIPYVALFPYALFTVFVMYSTSFRGEFFLSIAIASWSAALVWYLAPSGIMRKREIGLDFLSQMIVWIYEHDHENNTFPSSHVFYALICSYFLALALPQFALFFAAIGALISISTVLVKQHHVADILGGIVWAIGAVWISQLFLG